MWGFGTFEKKSFSFVFWYSVIFIPFIKTLLSCSGEWKNLYVNEFCALASKPFYKDGYHFSKHILFLFFVGVSISLIIYDAP